MVLFWTTLYEETGRQRGVSKGAVEYLDMPPVKTLEKKTSRQLRTQWRHRTHVLGTLMSKVLSTASVSPHSFFEPVGVAWWRCCYAVAFTWLHFGARAGFGDYRSGSHPLSVCMSLCWRRSMQQMKHVNCDTWCASTAFGDTIENLLPAAITKVKKQTRDKDNAHRNRKQQPKGHEPSH